MTRFGWLVFVIVLLVIAGIIGGWYLVMKYHPPVPAPVAVMATTTAEKDLSSSSIYTNGTYGFSVVYPAKDTVTETFTPWRSGAVATGTPLVAFADSDGTVRISASTNSKEVKACMKPGPAETALADLSLGSTTFNAFTHDDVGTDNEQRIMSYRAIHEKACISIETIRPITNGTLATSTSIDGIIQSFSFARP